MSRVRAEYDVLEAWQQFLGSCLTSPGDAAAYGKMRARLEGLPNNARVYADSFRAYRRQVNPPMPGPHAVQGMGRVMRALKLAWCSDLLLLYAASHLPAFVEVIIGAQYKTIRSDRCIAIIAALPKSVLPLRADTFARFDEIADLTPRKFKNRLDREELMPEDFDDYQDELTAREQVREKATLSPAEHAVFEEAWQTYVNDPQYIWTDRSGFIIARLVAADQHLPLTRRRALTLNMLCRGLIEQIGWGGYHVPRDLRVDGLPD